MHYIPFASHRVDKVGTGMWMWRESCHIVLVDWFSEIAREQVVCWVDWCGVIYWVQ